MKKPVFVWRESVYKNDFRCNKCNKKVVDENGNVLGNCLVSMDFPAKDIDTLLCPDCRAVLAMMSTVDAPLDGGFYGSMRDFMRNINSRDDFDKKESKE